MAQIFWGYLFIILSFKINSVELLPECLGYFFIMKGAIFLSHKVSKFAAIKPWASGLSIITLALYVNRLFIGFYLGPTISNIISLLLELAFFYVTYLIIIAMKDLELSVNLDFHIARLMFYFKIVIALHMVTEFTLLFGDIFTSDTIASGSILGLLVLILVSAFLIAKFIFMLLFIITIYQANVIYEKYIKSL